MKILTQDIYQLDRTEMGYTIGIELIDDDVYLEVNGNPVCCLTTGEAKALAKAMQTLSSLGRKVRP